MFVERLMPQKWADMLYDKNLHAVLEAMFKLGQATTYHVEKEADIPHSTTHKKILEALEAGLIRLVKEQPFRRTGLIRKFYAPTALGLLAYILRLLLVRYKEGEDPSNVLKELSSLRGEILLPGWRFLFMFPPEYTIRLLSEAALGTLNDHLEGLIGKEDHEIRESFVAHLLEDLGGRFAGYVPEDEAVIQFVKQANLCNKYVESLQKQAVILEKELTRCRNIIEALKTTRRSQTDA
jgi:hypothetical protein